MPTITLLIEDSLVTCKPIAASHDREILIDYASARYLHRDMRPLREHHATVEINQTTTLCLREVEFLCSSRSQYQPLSLPQSL